MKKMSPISVIKTDGAEAASWIQTLTNGDVTQEISLYFHIPFCRKKCPYCHFYSLAEKDADKDIFLDALLQEVRVYLPLIRPKKIVSIYFGGGTPSCFGPKRIECILTALQELTWDDAEITLEANPESLSFDDLVAYHELGINRISLGVQSFCQADLSLLSRSHNESEVRLLIEKSCEIGLNNISLDLMYDLPSQSLDAWKQTLRKAFSLPITHCSSYNLVIEPHTAFFRKKTEIESAMPKVAESLAMRTHLLREARAAGFCQYEISAFCKPDFYSRHNVGYWQGRSFFGFGPSAFSFFNYRFSNVSNLKKYVQSIKNGVLPIDYCDAISSQARLAELIAVGLRMNEGVHLPSLEARFGQASDVLQQTLNDLERNCLIEKCHDRYVLSRKGQLLHDEIASEIILLE
jgi:oxygen-independent coproporphyrinogen-3 oxidase